MDINPSYNCLLGRPWIHSAGAVPSSLHQKLKFVIDDKVVTIRAEEEMIANTFTDDIYIEPNEEALDSSFQSFEFINATFVGEGLSIVEPHLSKSTHSGLKMTVGKGSRAGKGLGKNLQGMARALQVITQTNKKGLGFQANAYSREQREKRTYNQEMTQSLG